MVNCKSYDYVKNETKFGKESKRLEYVEEEITIGAFMDKFLKIDSTLHSSCFFCKVARTTIPNNERQFSTWNYSISC